MVINKDEEILVSISCIAFNHAAYIKQCLDGFLMQECDFKFEVLIHDDASTDGTSEIIKEYQERYPEVIKPIIQKENQYSKGVRSIGVIYNMPRAKGKYIAICEGDDFWVDKYKLQKQVDILNRYKEVVVCFHNRYVVKDNIGTYSVAPFKRFFNYNNDKYLKNWLLVNEFIPMLTMLFRANVLSDYYNIKNVNVFGGDVFLKCYLSTKGDGYYSHFYGAAYRQHNGGVYSRLSQIDKRVKAIETREVILDQIPNINRRMVFWSMLKYSLLQIVDYIKQKDFKNGWKWSGKSFVYLYNILKG